MTMLVLQMAVKTHYQELDCPGRKRLSQSNLISDRWHRMIKFATARLFVGIVYHDWDSFKEMMTKTYFPGMLVVVGGGMTIKSLSLRRG
jgi:hypothetical protein